MEKTQGLKFYFAKKRVGGKGMLWAGKDRLWAGKGGLWAEKAG